MIPQKIPTEDARSGHPVRGATAARPTPERTSGIDPNVCTEYARITLKSVMNLGRQDCIRMHPQRGLPGTSRGRRPQGDAREQAVNVRIAGTARVPFRARRPDACEAARRADRLALPRGVRERHGIKRPSGRNQVLETARVATGRRLQRSDLVCRSIRYASLNEGTYFRVSEE